MDIIFFWRIETNFSLHFSQKIFYFFDVYSQAFSSLSCKLLFLVAPPTIIRQNAGCLAFLNTSDSFSAFVAIVGGHICMDSMS
jgi:hypothetical protein